MSEHVTSAASSVVPTLRQRGMPGRIAAALLLVLSSSAASAEAAAFTYSFVVDLESVSITDEPGGAEAIRTVLDIDPSIDLFAGDTLHLELRFAVDQALRLRDLVPVAGDESLSLGLLRTFTQAAEVSESLTLLGIAGDLLQNPLPDGHFDGNLTDSAFSFTGIVLDWTALDPFFPDRPVFGNVLGVRLTVIADDLAVIDPSTVPEPTTVVLLALGLGAARWRLRQALKGSAGSNVT